MSLSGDRGGPPVTRFVQQSPASLNRLVENVRWISDKEGDGSGYDIASFDANKRPRLIEVKVDTLIDVLELCHDLFG